MRKLTQTQLGQKLPNTAFMKLKNYFILGAVFISLSLLLLHFFSHEIYLHFWSLQDAELRCLHNPRRSEIIFTLTTVPHRLTTSLETSLKSLLLQSICPKAIHLYVPHLFRGESPYHFPAAFRDLTLIKIFRISRDLGPATKILPAVNSQPQNQPLLAVDDDLVYPPSFLEQFDQFSQLHPTAALSSRGWRVPRSLRWNESETVFGVQLKQPLQTDILTGCGGILVRPIFFSKCRSCVEDFDAAPREAFFVDDVWISGHLAKNGIEKLIIPVPERHLPQYLQPANGYNGLINSVNKDGKNNDVMLRWFSEFWKYDD
eukprot:TRINITY_DN6832_c0_g1_i1.p1 TRINITY_DN6832_c0_g1~~TRINITY_DN6832_c0_g1_i1.p1  ORF type:complete len:316 (-),score=51.60 TRINITY_DN6832_c0_g1_i1:153-1100(-)